MAFLMKSIIKFSEILKLIQIQFNKRVSIKLQLDGIVSSCNLIKSRPNRWYFTCSQSSHRLSLIGRVPITAAAFPLWTARLILCVRKVEDRESPVSEANRPPMSAQGLKVPRHAEF